MRQDTVRTGTTALQDPNQSGAGGDPGRTRTCYLQIRNLSLYPDELRDHAPSICRNSPLISRHRMRPEDSARRDGSHAPRPPIGWRRKPGSRAPAAARRGSQAARRSSAAGCRQRSAARRGSSGAAPPRRCDHAGSRRITHGPRPYRVRPAGHRTAPIPSR